MIAVCRTRVASTLCWSGLRLSSAPNSSADMVRPRTRMGRVGRRCRARCCALLGDIADAGQRGGPLGRRLRSAVRAARSISARVRGSSGPQLAMTAITSAGTCRKVASCALQALDVGQRPVLFDGGQPVAGIKLLVCRDHEVGARQLDQQVQRHVDVALAKGDPDTGRERRIVIGPVRPASRRTPPRATRRGIGPRGMDEQRQDFERGTGRNQFRLVLP